MRFSSNNQKSTVYMISFFALIYILRNLSGFVAAPLKRKIFIDKDGNEVPVFDDETLFPKPGDGYCKMTNITDKEQYFQVIENPEVECKQLERFNNYWGCIDGFKKKDNCVVLSFGIFHSFGYEDYITDKYGCRAYSFDPTIGKEDYERKNGMSKFFNLGLSSFKGVKKINYENKKDIPSKVDRYVNIVDMLGLKNIEVDFLKLDIEGSELDFFLDTASNNPEVFGKIKQMQIELHSMEQFPRWHSGNRLDTNQFDMMKIVDILHCHGFALAHSALHRAVKQQLYIYNGKERGACYITTWIRALE